MTTRRIWIGIGLVALAVLLAAATTDLATLLAALDRALFPTIDIRQGTP